MLRKAAPADCALFVHETEDGKSPPWPMRDELDRYGAIDQRRPVGRCTRHLGVDLRVLDLHGGEDVRTSALKPS